jgi:hypothetical protein
MAFLDDEERENHFFNDTATTEIYTLHEAEQTLPLVKSIVTDIISAVNELKPYEADLKKLNDGPRLNRSQLIDKDNLSHYIDKKVGLIRDMRDELHQLDIELRSARRGIVHWRSRICGGPVVFCWEPDQEKIVYWHYVGAPCDQR